VAGKGRDSAWVGRFWRSGCAASATKPLQLLVKCVRLASKRAVFAENMRDFGLVCGASYNSADGTGTGASMLRSHFGWAPDADSRVKILQGSHLSTNDPDPANKGLGSVPTVGRFQAGRF
jgi:hypothetical protein